MIYPTAAHRRSETTLNAISPRRPRETQDDRTDRQLDFCRTLAELGMGVARVTATCAMADYATPDFDEAPPPEYPNTETPAEPEPAAAAPVSTRRADAVLAFTRASRAVRQAITLENKIIAGDRPARTPCAPLDPRRAIVHRALRDAVKDHPDRREIHRDIDECLDHDLAADNTDIPSLFANICNELGITPDLAKLPDEILGMDTEPADQEKPTDWPTILTAYYGEPKPAPA